MFCRWHVFFSNKISVSSSKHKLTFYFYTYKNTILCYRCSNLRCSRMRQFYFFCFLFFWDLVVYFGWMPNEKKMEKTNSFSNSYYSTVFGSINEKWKHFYMCCVNIVDNRQTLVKTAPAYRNEKICFSFCFVSNDKWNWMTCNQMLNCRQMRVFFLLNLRKTRVFAFYLKPNAVLYNIWSFQLMSHTNRHVSFVI